MSLGRDKKCRFIGMTVQQEVLPLRFIQHGGWNNALYPAGAYNNDIIPGIYCTRNVALYQ